MTDFHEDHHTHADLGSADRLLSIGIDVGSATSQCAVSELYVGKRDPNLAEKPRVLHRHLLHQSPILLTPFLPGGMLIDAAELEHFVIQSCAAVGLNLDRVDTGAVICTGEAARKNNAAAISERLAAVSGKFVCAAAGHHLEAVLGAHGSGAVDISRGRDTPLVLLDVGGGTAKRTLLQHGRVLHTAAINIGARLIAWDQAGRIIRLENAGRRLAEAAGYSPVLGGMLDPAARDAIAARMAAGLCQFLGLAPMDDLSRDLLLTPLAALPDRFDLLLSGGLAEYVHGREQRDVGDLGLPLSGMLRRELAHGFWPGQVLDGGAGIRATVIGAGQFSVQVSGETVFLEGGLQPPLRGVPVHAVRVDWDDPRAGEIRTQIATAVRGAAPDGPCGFAFPPPPAHGYGAAMRLGQALAEALSGAPLPHGVVLVFEHNVARTVGAALVAGSPVPFMCLDELEIGDLDYLDVGRPVPGRDYLPVVVKSLVFEQGGTAHAPPSEQPPGSALPVHMAAPKLTVSGERHAAN